jgi:hypothetical protein
VVKAESGRSRCETDEVNEVFFPAALVAGVYLASNGNEYQKQKNNFSGE